MLSTTVQPQKGRCNLTKVVAQPDSHSSKWALSSCFLGVDSVSRQQPSHKQYRKDQNLAFVSRQLIQLGCCAMIHENRKPVMKTKMTHRYYSRNDTLMYSLANLTEWVPSNTQRPIWVQTFCGLVCSITKCFVIRLCKLQVQCTKHVHHNENSYGRGESSKHQTCAMSNSRIISPYSLTTSLHSVLMTPTAPIAWLTWATMVWKQNNMQNNTTNPKHFKCASYTKGFRNTYSWASKKWSPWVHNSSTTTSTVTCWVAADQKISHVKLPVAFASNRDICVTSLVVLWVNTAKDKFTSSRCIRITVKPERENILFDQLLFFHALPI